ncbi:MAG: hypothetical protein JWN99_779, partial [Ilumatobacteraceae bacterium]|nr:hypothetical protein [Ilumatobacteraceae bacterium]
MSPSRPALTWVAVAGALIVFGLFSSWSGARSIERNDARAVRTDFDRSSAEVGARLESTFEHQDDLVVNASGFVSSNPDATEAQFAQWAASVHVFDRHPELVGLGFVPTGDRPSTCLTPSSSLTDVTDTRTAQPPPPGTDWCAADGTGLDGRDTGVSIYSPLTIDGSQLLSVHVPVYRSGADPSTPEQRRAAFLGWVGTVSAPEIVLHDALIDRPGMAATLTYRDGTSLVVFAGGDVPQHPQTATITLRQGWTVDTVAVARARGVVHDVDARLLLLTGSALTFVLAALVVALGTGRSRAMRMVAERTDELQHQALHDALTGLPNRALIIDRIEHLLERNRRQGSSGAALYVDLDDFKNINDTLGHAAGDQLLVSVAARLSTTLRDADTIGRMGGDEFVVLIDGAVSESTPEVVAQRVLDVMRQPFVLTAAAAPMVINTSIGIA